MVWSSVLGAFGALWYNLLRSGPAQRRLHV
jgi:hypothetical protein